MAGVLGIEEGQPPVSIRHLLGNLPVNRFGEVFRKLHDS